MNHEETVRRFLKDPGVEIGAFKTPIPGIHPIYVDRFAEYANEPTLADYQGDACSLPFEDSSLNYVATSHVIEHVANPLSAFREWCRVLKHNGIIYMVVPDRRRTFDHPRPLTSVRHMIEDFHRGTTQIDGTHIDDFVFGVDWKQFSPDTPENEVQTQRKTTAQTYQNAISQRLEINIHFHTFEPDSMRRLLQTTKDQANFPHKIEILEIHPAFPDINPNGFLVVAKVKKAFSKRIKNLFASPLTPIKSEARKF
jgi:ubiquinone/menaquinone biosynthesis C-methylase UbiE